MTVLSKTRAAGAAGLALALLLTGVAPSALAKPAEKASAHKAKAATSSSKKKGGSTKGRASKATKSSKSKASASRSSSRSKGSSSRRSESKPVVQERITGSALGKVVEAEGPPRSYVVKRGQGLDGVAEATDLGRKQIAELNKLKAPYPLRPGQKLKLPPLKGKAYVSVAGDSMAAIAKRLGLTAKALSSYNNLGSTASIKPGRKLLLPSGFKDSGPLHAPKPEERSEPPLPQSFSYAKPGEGPTYSPPAYVPPSTPPAYKRAPPSLPPIQAPAQTPPPPVNAGDVATAGAGRFVWPLDGKVIQPFGTRAGQADDGITIATPVGTPVRAAAAGTIIYSGRQIAEFGNYVLVQHEGGFLTAYGNMDRVNVRMNQKIAQGDQIGLSGQTGAALQPQLHFEILFSARREDKSTPIDPLSLLPHR